MELLVNHHADNSKAAWLCLKLTNLPSASREYFAEAMNYRATAHTAKGATLLGLARYTALNARLAQGKTADVKPMVVSFMVAGRKREMTVPEDEAAEHRARYERDPEPLRLRAVELFEEVVAGYTAMSRSARRARPSPAWRPTPWRSSAPSRSASPPRRSPA